MGSNLDFIHQSLPMTAHGTYATVRFDQKLKAKPDKIKLRLIHINANI